MRRVSEPLTLALRVALGALLAYAAITKAMDLPAFAQDIANYHLVPAFAVPLLAAMLPGIELVVGGALILGRWTREAAAIATALFAAFTIALAIALARGISLSCGCFGGDDMATGWTIVRDLALVAAAAFVAWRGGPLKK